MLKRVALSIAALTLAATFVDVSGADRALARQVSDRSATAPTIARFTGEGFDKCLTPSTADMRSWLASPYRAVNIYFGGVNRACDSQPELTPQWVSTVTANGWGIIPTFVGLQSRCQGHKQEKFTETNAAAKGMHAADNAVDKLVALGIGAGNPVYYDMEPFNTDNASCKRAAADFISAWTAQLHARGYISGLYAHPTLGLKPMLNRSDPKPDDIWWPRYDGVDSTDLDVIEPTDYVGHRIHQYANSHTETFSGVTFQIDNDAVDADVVGAVTPTEPAGPPYVFAASPPSGATLKARTAPETAAGNTTGVRYAYGEAIEIECQAAGETLHGSYVWDRLTDGSYVNDINTTTTGGLGFTSGIPTCDKDAPTVTVDEQRPATLARSKVFTWSATDPDSGIGSYDARYRTATWSSRFGDWTPAHGLTTPALTVEMSPGTTTCVQVRATDRSGNVSRWSAKTCVARPLDDRGLTAASEGWTQGTADKYYLDTITRSTAAGMQLDRSGARVRRVGVVATTCPRCGAVDVYVGSRTPGNLVGSLSLATATKRQRTILLLPTFDLKHAAVHLVTTSARKVKIDGLVVSRR